MAKPLASISMAKNRGVIVIETHPTITRISMIWAELLATTHEQAVRPIGHSWIDVVHISLDGKKPSEKQPPSTTTNIHLRGPNRVIILGLLGQLREPN